mgnify:CR=1 FL=1
MWSPLDGNPQIESPGAIEHPSMSFGRSTTPTMHPDAGVAAADLTPGPTVLHLRQGCSVALHPNPASTCGMQTTDVRVSANDDYVDKLLVRYAVDTLKKSKPGLLLENTAWGQSNEAGLTKYLGQKNVKLYPESTVGWSQAGLPMTNVPTRLAQFWLQLREATGNL